MIKELDQHQEAFRFSEPRQQRLYHDLRELIGPGPAAFFRDACWLMDRSDELESTAHLVAHLLRDIESALRDVLKPIAQSVSDQPPETEQHKKQIKAILQALNISEDKPEAQAWFELAERLHRIAHRRGLDAPRSVAEIRNLWEKAQDLLTVLIHGIREHFLVWLEILDRLLSKAQPTRDDIKKLANEVPNNRIARGYFFDRLQNPAWLEPLWKKGFFRRPPNPERNEEEGTIRFPSWPEARYLARMARHKPEIVARIIQGIPDTENASVQADLTDALLAMPPDVAVSLFQKALGWAESPYLLLPEKLGQFITHLAKGGMTKEAMAIAQVLLDAQPDPRQQQISESARSYWSLLEPQARFNTWQYEQILKKHYPNLVRLAGLPALELLCDLLGKAIRLSWTQESDETDETHETLEDYSSIWRPAIEDHAQNIEHTLKDVLVSGVRDAAELAIRSGKATVEEVVDALERRQWKVFHRIAIHVLRVFSRQAITLVRTRLTDRSLFEERSLRHEYVLLMQKCFVHLTPDDQAKILDWIEAGPDVERFKEWRQGEGGSLPTEEVARYRDIWQRDRLAWIGPENLPRDWQERYRTLVEIYGALSRPEFVKDSVTWVVGPTSPKTAEELKAMTVTEIVDFLQVWIPPDGIFGAPSPEGLGRVLSSVVAGNPKRFALEAAQFQGLDPTYIRAFFSGLQEGLKHQRAFDWRPVLALCLWVLDQPRQIPGRQVRNMEADPDWSWARKAIAGLLSAGFKDGTGCIPIQLREKVWNVLKPLTDDPDPTPEYEQQYGGSNMDPATLSINTTRGEAMHAVIRYGLWVQRHIKTQRDAEEWLSMGFDEMPEIREVLDAHLDMAREPSLAIRAVYGQWFPWLVLLDSRWARDNATRIFPTGQGEDVDLDAAWNTYITFCGPYDSTFDILREQYRHAVERIGSRRDDTRWLADPDKKLVEHLMAFYWRGKLLLDDSLLMAFWEKAPDALRRHTIGFVGRALSQTDETISQEILNRLRALWESRMVQAAQNPDNHREEIAAFGWWFVADKFDVNWAIAQLFKSLQLVHKTEPDHMVLEHLAKTVETHPVESVECLMMIAEGDRDRWSLYASRNYVQRILEVALQRPDSSEKARQIIHYLGSRGFLEFRNLL